MFAENERISYRQLFRQMVLSMIAPFMLCIAGLGQVRGVNGFIATVLVLFLLYFFVIFLVRLGTAFEHMEKYMGKIQSKVICFIYLVYILFTAAYLVNLTGKLGEKWLLSGENEILIKAAIVLVCMAGTRKEMERRSRLGEVSFGIIVGGILLLLFLSCVQGNHFSVKEFLDQKITAAKIGTGCYQEISGFLPMVLFPFLYSHVEKAPGSGKILRAAIFFLGILLGFLIFLLPVTLGWDRMSQEEFPILPLLAGTNLPGNVMARFDVIWISLFIYSLFYSIGSLFYYSNYIKIKYGFPGNSYITAAVIWLLACNPLPGQEIEVYYKEYLIKAGIPVMIFLTIYVYIWYRRKCE
jgi:hypothetical protein